MNIYNSFKFKFFAAMVAFITTIIVKFPTVFVDVTAIWANDFFCFPVE
jgi:hypothetical protein